MNEEEFREKHKQCNNTDCEDGDFREDKSLKGVVYCSGCIMRGKDFGKLMVMPEGFKMPLV